MIIAEYRFIKWATVFKYKHFGLNMEIPYSKRNKLFVYFYKVQIEQTPFCITQVSILLGSRFHAYVIARLFVKFCLQKENNLKTEKKYSELVAYFLPMFCSLSNNIQTLRILYQNYLCTLRNCKLVVQKVL